MSMEPFMQSAIPARIAVVPYLAGEVSGTTVTCPWHRAQYDLKTGGVLTPPAPQGVASYKVVVEGDAVSIEL